MASKSMDLDELALIRPAWHEIPHDPLIHENIILKSAAVVRRNIAGHRFPPSATRSMLYDAAAIALNAIGRVEAWNGCDFRRMEDLNAESVGLLLEDAVITSRSARAGDGRFVMRGIDGKASCLLNESDHIRMTYELPGARASEAVEGAMSFIDAVDLDLAVDPILGALTASPNHVGSGLTVSMLLHMPALDVMGETGRTIAQNERQWPMVSIVKLVSDKNISMGSFYVVRNKVSLGSSLDEITLSVNDAARTFAARELFMRFAIRSSKNSELSDRLWRAWGLLRYARKLSYTEAVNKLSFIKLGMDLDILPSAPENEWRALLANIGRYRMRAVLDGAVDIDSEPYERASMIRDLVERYCAKRMRYGIDSDKEVR